MLGAEPWVPLVREKLVVSRAATAGPNPGTGSAPCSAAADARSPWDDFSPCPFSPPKEDLDLPFIAGKRGFYPPPVLKEPPAASSRSYGALAKAVSRAWGLMWPWWGFTLSGA